MDFFGVILSDNCDIFSTLLENVELDQTGEKWTGKYKNIIIYGFYILEGKLYTYKICYGSISISNLSNINN